MSIFRAMSMTCPNCRKESVHDAVFSVNADRRLGLRNEIVDETFQRATCPHCGTEFRLDPEFVFVHAAKHQWIAAYPLAKMAHWQALEGEAAVLFDKVYGAEASERLQEAGRALNRRITFGWAGLREKLVAADKGLDDVTIELCKAAVLRGSEESPIAAESELRLLDAGPKQLVFGWIRSEDESTAETLGVSRELYDEIAADADGGWAALRADLGAGGWVDLNRMMLA